MHRHPGLSHQQIEIAQRLLPDFAAAEVLAPERCAAALQAYFACYGFTDLQGRVACDYRLGWLGLPDYRLVLHYWQPRQVRATVLVCHGLFDHVGIYLDLIEMLLRAGYAVAAMDFPGHGLSEGERAVIDDFDEYALLIDEIIAALGAQLQGPLYALGQSTGSAALMNYLLRDSGPGAIEKVALLAPLVVPRGWFGIRLAHRLAGGFTEFVPRRFSRNSHDEAFAAFIEHHDPLQPRSISVRWVGAMNRWARGFVRLPPSAVPVLVVQGSADQTVDWQKNIPLIQGKFRRAQVLMVNGAMHHLVNEGEAWRSQVFAAVARFFAGDPAQ